MDRHYHLAETDFSNRKKKSSSNMPICRYPEDDSSEWFKKKKEQLVSVHHFHTECYDIDATVKCLI